MSFEEALRVPTVEEAARAVLTMWDEAIGDDGYLNQQDAYYRLYKGKTPLYEALRLALQSAPPPGGVGEGWVVVPRAQLERFTALNYVHERLTLVYSGKGRPEGRPEVIDEIWAIIANLASMATELSAVPAPPLGGGGRE